jgi:Cytochrome c7 and related cytochrome c
MAQLFHRSTNALSRLTIFGTLFAIVAIAWGLAGAIRSPYMTEQNVVREQPVPFSHQHHVGGLGIDCRYCHTSVEVSSFAGVPPTQICMNCHRQVWSDSPMLEPVRASLRENKPIIWTRVHNLPDFVYFDHGIHVQQGVGCETCHGRVDQMPVMWKAESMSMEWCLNCHRHPEKFLRPRDEVFTMGYQATTAQSEIGAQLLKMYRIDPPSKLTNCSVCHR